jgi:hypothetical protein
MVRSLLAGLALLIAAAAFGCSGSVAPPGAMLSGTVFYDQNANGVRDSCDDDESIREVPTVQIVRADGEGKPLTAWDSRGRWQMKDVPPGDYIVGIHAPTLSSRRWLVTSPPVSEGDPRYELSLRGFESKEGLDFGIVDPFGEYLGNGSYDVQTFVFEDINADGEAGVDECVISNGLNPLVNQLVSFDTISTTVDSGDPRQDLWQITTSGRNGDCFEPIQITTNAEDELQHLGVQRVYGTTTLVVNVFNDLDADGNRDNDEPPIHNSKVHVQPAGELCMVGQAFPARTGEGEVTYYGLPRGDWLVNARVDCCTSDPVPAQSIEVTTGNDLTSEVSFGFSFPIRSTIIVTVVDDTNGNGEPDTGEQTVPETAVCIERWPPMHPNAHFPMDSCQGTDPSGRAYFRDLNPAQYTVIVDLPERLEATWETGPEGTLDLDDGGSAEITLLVRRPVSNGGISGCTAISC